MLRRWGLRISCVLLFAALPWIGTAPWVLGVLALPLVCACWRAVDERAEATVILLTFLASALGLVSYVQSNTAIQPLMQRLFLWQDCITAGMMLLVWCFSTMETMKRAAVLAAVLGLACTAVTFFPHKGIPDDLMAWLSTWEQTPKLLINLYASGLLPLEASLKEIAMMHLGYLMPNVMEQLMLALRGLLERLLPSLLPQVMVWYAGVTAIVCAAARDAIRAKRVGWREMPRFEKWYLPRGWGLPAALLWLGGLAPYVTGGIGGVCFGAMCTAAFSLIFTIQGLCLVWWWTRDRAMSAAASVGCMVALGVLASFALTLLGLIDQSADPRHLRSPLLDDGEDDGLE